jgi:hypothetical protein
MSIVDKSMNVLGQVRLFAVLISHLTVLASSTPVTRVTSQMQLDGRIILAPVIAE